MYQSRDCSLDDVVPVYNAGLAIPSSSAGDPCQDIAARVTNHRFHLLNQRFRFLS